MSIKPFHRGRRPGRALALLLLAVVLADLNDADCDPLRIGPARPGIASSGGPPADECGEFCIPDCFCCSVMLPAQPAFVLERTPVVSETPQPPSLTPVAGHAPVPDHVPIPPAPQA